MLTGERSSKRTSVPDLSLDGLVVDVDATGSKLDTDSRLGFEVELVSCESREYYMSVLHQRINELAYDFWRMEKKERW